MTSRQNNELILQANANYGTYAQAGVPATRLNLGNGGQFIFSNAPSGSAVGDTISFTTRMTLDASGNLLVGSTDTTPYDRTSGNAISLGDGLISSAQSGGNAAIFNRMTSDGSIVGFRKGGTAVGSIAASGGDILIGGSGSANHLDDYEEGTWTPAYSNGGSVSYTTQEGTYTKIGRLVNLNCKIDVDSVSGTNSNAMQITGAPFTNNGPDETGGSVGINLSGWLNSEGTDMIQINATDARILPAKDTTNDIFRGTDIGTGFVCWSITYMTDQ